MENISQNTDEGGKSFQSLFCLEENELYNLYVGRGAGKKLRYSIETAKKSIRIASPYVTADEIELLREKCLGKMGNIKIITSADDDLENMALVNGLKALIHREKTKNSSECEYTSIFDAVFFRGSFFHAKFYIIDDELAYVGSINFTGKGLEKSIETCITLKDPNAVQKLIVFFDQLFIANKYKWDVSVLGKIVYDKWRNYSSK